MELAKEPEDTDVRFSTKHTKEMSYEEQMNKMFDVKGNNLNHGDSIYIGVISNNADAFGISDSPFVMNQTDIKKSMQGKHKVKQKIIRRLPTLIKDSVMAIDRGNQISIITEEPMIDTKGNPSLIIVGVHKDVEMDGEIINLAKSVYPLDNLRNVIFDRRKNLVIIDKNRADKILAGVGIPSPERTNIVDSAKESISQNESLSQEQKSVGNYFSTRLSEPTAADYAFLNEKRSRPSVQERYAATMRQYRALQAQISKAKKELGTAGQHIMSEKALDMFAKKVKKDSQTTMTMDELKERLQAIYDYTVVNDTDTVKEFSESVLYNAVYELASDMLKQAEMTKAERLAVDFGEEGLVDALNNIESMRGKSVLISNEMHNELNSGKAGFDSYAEEKSKTN